MWERGAGRWALGAGRLARIPPAGYNYGPFFAPLQEKMGSRWSFVRLRVSVQDRMNSNLSIRETVEWLRDDLVEQRHAVRKVHDRQLTGPRVSAKLTTLIDTVVSRLFDATLAELAPDAIGLLRANIAIVALGSYGRRQCAPFSDVDLMILHQTRHSDEIAAQLRPLTQGVFDVGLQLGHSIRTENEAVQLARDDAVICTSLIDSRFLLGNQQLFESFRASFQKMVQRNSRALCRTFLDARGEEHRQYGETVYLLEPHVKRSRGGLRDLNLLSWLGFAEHGVADPDRLHLQGALSKQDYHRLQSARAFLLRLRNEMHFHAESSRDLLDRAEQLRVAEWHGHTHHAGLLPVENFMRDYFRHSNHLWQMVRRRDASLQVGSRVSRVLEPVLGKNVDGDYRVGLRSVSATASGVTKLKQDLREVLRFVELSVRTGKPIEYAAWSVLLLAAPDFTEGATAEVNQQFYNMLADPQTVGEIVRVLHELGYLEKLVPAMRHARCLLQFNQYHKYTVDEHCLRSVRRASEFGERNDSLGNAYREVQDKRRLHLALLLHDLGKGFEEDHSEVGRKIAEETCALLGLDEPSSEDVKCLVHKHLVMSHLAFRRDTSDQGLIKNFSDEIGSVERLKMLFVMTCADLAAVGPGVLNDWKIEVLADVFARAVPMFALPEEVSPESQLASHRRAVYESLTADEQANAQIVDRIEALPPSFIASCEVPEVVDALRRFRRLTSESAAVAWGVFQSRTKTMQFTAGVSQGVGRGVFSSMAGALSSAGLEILSASTDVLPEKFLMLRYLVTDPRHLEVPSAEYLEQTSQALVAVVESQEAPRFPQVWGREKAEAATRLSALPNEVRIDNSLTEDFTIVEVFTFDRVGLLYLLARKLHDLKLVIAHAKIATYLDQVVDVFYVTDREGHSVTDEQRLNELRRELLAVAETK
ncbi:MAG: [protein-PII] uridylyltransferase [Pirellulales bacterium]|nr:[protein-PII] uridylyltransferase [Pirellulales bacterium]